jgi:hypothetical protein
MNPSKLTKVCKKDCDNKPYKVKVKNTVHLFCCKKGFEQSLKDFADYIATKTQTNEK